MDINEQLLRVIPDSFNFSFTSNFSNFVKTKKVEQTLFFISIDTAVDILPGLVYCIRGLDEIQSG